MKIYKEKDLVIIETKAEKRFGISLDKLGLSSIKKYKDLKLSGLISLQEDTETSAKIVDGFYDAGMPLVYTIGQYEMDSMVVQVYRRQRIMFAEILLDQLIILYPISKSKVEEKLVGLPDCEILIGEPEAVADLQFVANPEFVVLMSGTNLAEYTNKTGITDIERSKKIKVNIKPGQDTAGLGVKVQLLITA